LKNSALADELLNHEKNMNPIRKCGWNKPLLDLVSYSQIFVIFLRNVKNVVFWDVALCRSGVNRRFGGTYRLHLQGRKIRE
jgi:hypothetical protein